MDRQSKGQTETNFFMDFVLNDRRREKTITQEKHPGCIAHGHKLAALMKKRKEEILHSKEVFSAVYSTVYRAVFSTAYSTVYSTVK